MSNVIDLNRAKKTYSYYRERPEPITLGGGDGGADLIQGDNIGGAPGNVFSDKTGYTLNFRSLTGSNGILVLQHNSFIEILPNPDAWWLTSSGGGDQTLLSVLQFGNITGPNDIILSPEAALRGENISSTSSISAAPFRIFGGNSGQVGSSAGADLVFKSGEGQSPSGKNGDVIITSGEGSSPTAGNLYFLGKDNEIGSNVFITSGAPATGSATSQGGNININTPEEIGAVITAGPSGNVNIFTGGAGKRVYSQSGANINFTTAKRADGYGSGEIVFTTGDAASYGQPPGDIKFNLGGAQGTTKASSFIVTLGDAQGGEGGDFIVKSASPGASTGSSIIFNAGPGGGAPGGNIKFGAGLGNSPAGAGSFEALGGSYLTSFGGGILRLLGADSSAPGVAILQGGSGSNLSPGASAWIKGGDSDYSVTDNYATIEVVGSQADNGGGLVFNTGLGLAAGNGGDTNFYQGNTPNSSGNGGSFYATAGGNTYHNSEGSKLSLFGAANSGAGWFKIETGRTLFEDTTKTTITAWANNSLPSGPIPGLQLKTGDHITGAKGATFAMTVGGNKSAGQISLQGGLSGSGVPAQGFIGGYTDNDSTENTNRYGYVYFAGGSLSGSAWGAELKLDGGVGPNVAVKSGGNGILAAGSGSTYGGSLFLGAGMGNSLANHGNVHVSGWKFPHLQDALNIPRVNGEVGNALTITSALTASWSPVMPAHLTGTLTTTSTTPAVLYTYATPVDLAVYSVNATVTARDQTNGQSNVYELKAAFERTSGSVNQIGTTQIIFEREQASALDVTFTTSTTNIVLNVTGSANATRWKSWMEVKYYL